MLLWQRPISWILYTYHEYYITCREARPIGGAVSFLHIRGVRLDAALRRLINLWHQSTARAILKHRKLFALAVLDAWFKDVTIYKAQNTQIFKSPKSWTFWCGCKMSIKQKSVLVQTKQRATWWLLWLILTYKGSPSNVWSRIIFVCVYHHQRI